MCFSSDWSASFRPRIFLFILIIEKSIDANQFFFYFFSFACRWSIFASAAHLSANLGNKQRNFSQLIITHNELKEASQPGKKLVLSARAQLLYLPSLWSISKDSWTCQQEIWSFSLREESEGTNTSAHTLLDTNSKVWFKIKILSIFRRKIE